MTYTRPRLINRTSWRHLQNSAAAAYEGSVLCQEAVDEVDPDKLEEAVDEFGTMYDEVTLASDAL